MKQGFGPTFVVLIFLLMVFGLLQSAFSQEPYLVKDINPGSDSSFSYTLVCTNVNDTLFFSADDGVSGEELWKSNGTAAGTVMIKDIKSGSNGSWPKDFVNMNGTVFFIADDGGLRI